MNHAQLTVIIPTLADTQRAATLLRAIDSVTCQKDIPTTILVVVNGQRFDPHVLAALESRHDLQWMQVEKPSLSNAIYQGRLAVQTPYFSFLDDDDEYLEGSVRKRIEALEKNPDCVMVASKGFRETAGVRTPSAANLAQAQHHPFRELAINNWMTSCGAVFRSRLAAPEVFNHVPPHHEWTYLAYQLLLLGPFCIVDEPCYIVHDTPHSLSKSAAYSEAPAQVLREVLKTPLPSDVAQSVKARLSRAEHDLANMALSKGMRWRALQHHLRSLVLPGGWQYVLFTRHLLKP